MAKLQIALTFMYLLLPAQPVLEMPTATVDVRSVELLPDHITRRIIDDEAESATRKLGVKDHRLRGIFEGAKR